MAFYSKYTRALTFEHCSSASRLTADNSACVPRTLGPSPADAAASVTERGSHSEVSNSPARSTDGPSQGDEAASVTAQPHRTRGRRRGLESRQGEGEPTWSTRTPEKMLNPMATWMSASSVTCQRGDGAEGGDVAYGCMSISSNNSNRNRYASNSRPPFPV